MPAGNFCSKETITVLPNGKKENSNTLRCGECDECKAKSRVRQALWGPARPMNLRALDDLSDECKMCLGSHLQGEIPESSRFLIDCQSLKNAPIRGHDLKLLSPTSWWFFACSVHPVSEPDMSPAHAGAAFATLLGARLNASTDKRS